MRRSEEDSWTLKAGFAPSIGGSGACLIAAIATQLLMTRQGACPGAGIPESQPGFPRVPLPDRQGRDITASVVHGVGLFRVEAKAIDRHRNGPLSFRRTKEGPEKGLRR